MIFFLEIIKSELEILEKYTVMKRKLINLTKYIKHCVIAYSVYSIFPEQQGLIHVFCYFCGFFFLFSKRDATVHLVTL